SGWVASFRQGSLAGQLNFDGSDDYINVGAAPIAAGSAELSCFLWARSSTGNTGNPQHLVGAYQAGGSFAGWGFAWYYPGNFTIGAWNGSTWTESNTFLFADGAWHRIGFAFRGGVLTFYLDGQPWGGASASAPAAWTCTKAIGARADGISLFTG